MQRRQHFSRRDFLKSTTAGVALLSSGVWSQTARAASRSVQDKLNIACIGTANRVLALGSDARRDEIARMLGGIEITRETRAHAASMLKAARS